MDKVVFFANGTSAALPRLGLGYLCAYLKQEAPGIEVGIIEAKEKSTLKQQIGAIKDRESTLVGFSSISMDYEHIKELAILVTDQLEIPCFIGGPHITGAPQSLDPAFAFAVLGEGEVTTSEIINHWLVHKEFLPENIARIPGLAFHDGSGKVCFSPPRDLIADIDSLPLPSRDLLDVENVSKKARRLSSFSVVIKKMMSIVTSRGCPYNCVYCSAKAFWRKARYRSAESVLNEIEFLLDHYAFDTLHPIDDLFIGDMKRLRILSSEFKKRAYNKSMQLWVSARANLFTKEVAHLLAEMNTVHVAFGFESGSDRILKYLKGTGINVEQNYKAAELAHKMNMRVEAGIILGSPGETIDDMNATYRFLTNSPIDAFGVQILSPLPGTQLWEQAKSENLVSDIMNFDRLWNWNADTVLSDPDSFIYFNNSVPKKEFLKVYKRFANYLRKKGGYGDSLGIILSPDLRIWANIIRNPDLIMAAAKKSLIAIIGKSPILFKILRNMKRFCTQMYQKILVQKLKRLRFYR